MCDRKGKDALSAEDTLRIEILVDHYLAIQKKEIMDSLVRCMSKSKYQRLNGKRNSILEKIRVAMSQLFQPFR